MVFIKQDDVFFNTDDLEKAIKRNTNAPKDMYKVSVRNGYPCICIAHKHYRIHRLLGELYYGSLYGYSIHHIDGNKKNNTKENLQLISNSEHSILHQLGKDYRTQEGMMKSVMAMANAKRRSDIEPEEVRRLRDKGYTYRELCEYFSCGNSVISRCLKNRLE